MEKQILFLIGASLIAGYLGGKLSNLLKFPAVIGYIIIGLFMGTSVFNVLKLDILESLGIISDIALGIVAFSIGSELQMSVMKKMGKGIVTIIFTESFGAFFLVGVVVFLYSWLIKNNPIHLAITAGLIFGALAPASAPAGTVVVLQEYRAKGPLTNSLLAVVGLDDGLAIVIYGFAAAIASTIILPGAALNVQTALITPVKEIGGAILSGAIIGIVTAFFARKVHSKSELLIITIGAIFICSGLCNHFHFSLILANLVLGMVVINSYIGLGQRMYGVVREITPPIYVVFFVIAGAHLQLRLLPAMGVLGVLYIIFRAAGLIGGAFVGAIITKAETVIKKYLGLGILSQAGVAIGLALMVQRTFIPMGEAGADLALLVINTIAATTIIFEIVGPLTTKIAITKADEIGKAET